MSKTVRKKIREREAKRRGLNALFREFVHKLMRRDARGKLPEKAAVQAVVNRLTNWQRNQWARAGYPGLRENDVSQVESFSQMKRGSFL